MIKEKSKSKEIIGREKGKDKETTTDQVMHDIIRLDLSSEINEFSVHVQNKIERLDERMRFVNYKFEDVRFWFRRYSISIIYLATTLTLIEALMNSFNIEDINSNIIKNFIKFFPLLLSSLVSLIAAIIKFNKYEEKIEDITRATEKCIITIAKLKEVKEELYFCKTVESFIKINDRFTRDIYTEYLESNTNIERQLLDTDYAKYMKKVAFNDVQRAKILLKRNLELDELGELTLNKVRINPLRQSLYKKVTLTDESSNSSDIDETFKNKKSVDYKDNKNNCKLSNKRLSIAAQHNLMDRQIPYRGNSPPPSRSNICNKKMTPKTCNVCQRNFLLELDNKDQRCPYCKSNINTTDYNEKSNENTNNIDCKIDMDIDCEMGLSPQRQIERYANCIQKKWRIYKNKKNPRNF